MNSGKMKDFMSFFGKMLSGETLTVSDGDKSRNIKAVAKSAEEFVFMWKGVESDIWNEALDEDVFYYIMIHLADKCDFSYKIIYYSKEDMLKELDSCTYCLFSRDDDELGDDEYLKYSIVGPSGDRVYRIVNIEDRRKSKDIKLEDIKDDDK